MSTVIIDLETTGTNPLKDELLCVGLGRRRAHSTISGEIAQRIADYIGRYEARKA